MSIAFFPGSAPTPGYTPDTNNLNTLANPKLRLSMDVHHLQYGRNLGRAGVHELFHNNSYGIIVLRILDNK
eukprot:6190766-Pleurochrysis_carterae.AAC.3